MPAPLSGAGAYDPGEDPGHLRAELLMSKLVLDGHVHSLGKLQAEFAASRVEAGQLRTLAANQGDHIALLEKHAAELRAALDQQTGECEAAAARLAAETASREGRAAEAAAARAELDRLLGSLSWRLTTPLRALVARVRSG